MQILKNILLASTLLISGAAQAQVVFDYNPPALGSSEATRRNDLNAELDGINTAKVDFVDIDTSAELAAIIGDETGSGALVFAASPALTTPNLGTPSALTLTNATGLPIAGITGLGTGVGTWLATPSSANLASAVTGEVGTGAIMFGLASGMADDLTCSGLQVVRRNTGDTAFECAADDDIPDAADYSNLSATSPITQSGGTISTSISTGRLVGRTTAAAGVMEQITPDATLSLTGLALSVVDVTCTGCLGATEIAALAAGDITTGTFADALVDGSLESDEVKPTESFCLALSDETTAITTGTAKVTWRMPYAFTLTGIRGSLNTVSSSGAPIIDVNEAGTSIMTTNKVLIDVSEKTSVTAATAPTITDTSLADDAEMTADVDTAGTGAKGLKICLIGNRT